MPEVPVDLRSDTVTRPTAAMRRAMAEAEVGDDVLGDDPTVRRLEERVAAIMGKEAACFVPSGTMANQAAIRAHTEPGDEVIAHPNSHIIHYEAGGPAALSGVMVRPVESRGGDFARGLFDGEDLPALVRADNAHFARSRLVVMENTNNRGGGSVWSVDRVGEVSAAARGLGLRVHIDGARIWNACAATGREAEDFARHADTVSCCFSKGLGAPVGSAVAGPADLLHRVRRFRKMFGGGMRQSGILAAACLHALEHHRTRLAEDHEHALRLAHGLSGVRGLSVALPVETNIVLVDVAGSPWDGGPGTPAQNLVDRLKARGVWILPTGPGRVRFVTHLDVSRAMIDRALRAAEEEAAAA
ncbi:MAG: DegT/DnrJ/EryC1/StrS family aminotransferase [Phycisphaerales bacterium]|nr:DegT/DnrJ/EryC1/StrS family aminotransferase [Phycisphaerales bacterium]